MNGVLVISNTKTPLMPTSPARARKLLYSGKAAVFRRFPFTIILKNRSDGDVQPIRTKLDPGSKQTGIALVNEVTKKVIFAMIVVHRGMTIEKSILSRKGIRNSRRNRKTRYRKPGLPNTIKPKGWLAPSLLHRPLTVMTWVNRLRKFSPVTDLSMELVKFDMQLMENPEISGIEYQQGTLAGYEVREYQLEKWGRACMYCDAKDVPLQIEHIKAKTNGGSNRICNLGLACEPCNLKKGKLDIRVFLKDNPELLEKILSQAKRPLKDAAAVNSTRWNLFEKLQKTGLPVETGSGGRTKFNRTKQGYQKEHWIDAACVGVSGSEVFVPDWMAPLIANAAGHGNRQMCKTDKFGFPISHRTRQKIHFGFQTGDMVKAVVPKGKRIGTHIGRLLTRATGSFDIQTPNGRVAGISYKYIKPIQKMDGYRYVYA